MSKKVCDLCSKGFANKSSLTRHYKRVHSIKVSGSLACCECAGIFSSLATLRHHYVELHGFSDEVEILEFNSQEEFLKWKQSEEIKRSSQFVMHNGRKKLAGEKTRTYYFCNRSGYYVSKGKGKRRLKAKGSCRIEKHCLCGMKITEYSDGKFHVEYHRNHYGHSTEMKHLMRSKVQTGASLEENQDSAHAPDSCSEDEPCKDLCNIINCYTMNYATKIAEIQKAHKQGLNIPANYVKFIQETSVYEIKSQSENGLTYQVKQNPEKNCSDCKLVCQPCKTCMHTFVCTCTDHRVNFCMCKHIHAVVLQRNATDNPNLSEDIQGSQNGFCDPQDITDRVSRSNPSVRCSDQNLSKNRVVALAESLVKHVKNAEFDLDTWEVMEKELSHLLLLLEKNSSDRLNQCEPAYKKMRKQEQLNKINHIQRKRTCQTKKRSLVKSAGAQ